MFNSGSKLVFYYCMYKPLKEHRKDSIFIPIFMTQFQQSKFCLLISAIPTVFGCHVGSRNNIKNTTCVGDNYY